MLPVFVERAILNGLMTTATVAGTSFYEMQERRMRQAFEAYGLHPYRARLGDAEVHYWAGGNPQGRPLLLVHGFGADAMWGWVGQLALAKSRFLIVPDLLWFGASHGRTDDFSSTYQGEVLARLLDHLALHPVDVAGISYGGFVALELAVAVPERVRRLVLIDSPGPTYTLDDYQAMLVRQRIGSVSELIVPAEPAGVRRLVALAYHRPPPVPMFVARDIFRHMFRQWAEEKVRLLDDLIGRAGTVGVADYQTDHETLVLWGEHDELFPLDLAHRLSDALGARSHVRVLPRTNHAPNLERPFLFNRELLSFVGA